MQRLRLCSTVTHQLLRSVHPPSSSAAFCSTIATPNHKGFVAAAPLVTGSGNSTRPFPHFSTCVSPESSFIATATYNASSSTDSISSWDLRCNPPLCKSEQHPTRSSSQATGARQPMTVLRQPQMHSYAYSQQLRHFSAAAKQSTIHSWSASRTYSASAEDGSAGGNISGGEICWQCNTAVPSGSLFFCPECSVILPANQGANFYSVMGISEANFAVDLDDLEAKYRALQRVLHPDKFTTSSREEQEHSTEQASLVNQAYSVLRNPLKRAIFLLEQAGLIDPDKDGEGLRAMEDQEMLMAIMEAREEIDNTNDGAELQKLWNDNQSTAAQEVQEIEEAFGSGDLEKALELAIRLRYTTRIGEAIQLKL